MTCVRYSAVVGTYTGNGVDNRNIALTTLDSTFPPSLVLVKGGANIAVARSASMKGDFTKRLVGATAGVTDRIQNMNEAGFQIGQDAQVNTNGTVYHYLALFQVGLSKFEGTTTFNINRYTGDGVDNRSITSVGFQPNIVIVMSEGAHKAVWKTSDMAGDTSQFFDAALAANAIQALEADGFQIGTDTSVNNPATIYHYVCIKTTPTRDFVKTYTGNATDDRTITDANTIFLPACVLVKADSTQAACIRFNTETGDASFLLDASAEAADQIQAFSAGGYQVGTRAATNASTIPMYSVAILTSAVGDLGPTMSTTVTLPDMTVVVFADRAN